MQLTVDLVLAVVGVLSVWRAWRRGAIVAAASLVGWVAGLWLGVVIAPLVVSFAQAAGWVDPVWRTVAVIVAVMLCSAIFNALLQMIASAIHRAVRHVPVARGIDAIGGAAIGAFTWGLVVWLLAGFLQSTSFLPLAQLADSSRIVATLNQLAPVPSSRVLASVDDAIGQLDLPNVFEGGEGDIPKVAAPDPSVPAALAKASASVVEVLADEPKCGTQSTGSGWVVSPGRVVTNAHVVAGAATAAVRIAGKGPSLEATVVSYDPETDLAVLAVDKLPLPALATDAAQLSADAQVYAAGYPGGGPYDVVPARVRAVIEAKGKDIYDAKTVVRQVYSLRAAVRPGNSGGPLLDGKGTVVGVVFARSLSDDQTGYALTLSEVQQKIAAATGTKAVSTGACAQG